MANRIGVRRKVAPAQRNVSGLILVAVLWLAAPKLVEGYALEGPKWPIDSAVTFQLSLGDSGRTLADGNTSWNTAAAPAFGYWNQSVLHVQFTEHEASSAATSNDRVNTIAFATTVFGQTFGSNTLAVTYYHYSISTMTETDVLFNVNQSFDSYRGPLRFDGTGYDIRRVLIHELGHALGLDHPDQHGQQVDAIMNSVLSNRESPSNDDISGAQFLYGIRLPISPAIKSMSRMPNGHIVLQCVGAPNAVNRVEVASNPEQSFTDLISVAAGTTGLFQFEDSDAATFGKRFYRVAYP